MLPVFASAGWIPTGGKADEKEGWAGGTSPSGSSSSVVPGLGMRAQARAYLSVSNLFFGHIHPNFTPVPVRSVSDH